MIINRLKPIMDSIISGFQSAFIPNTNIIDNIIMDHELLHTMKHNMKEKNGKIVVTLDMSKAYD